MLVSTLNSILMLLVTSNNVADTGIPTIVSLPLANSLDSTEWVESFAIPGVVLPSGKWAIFKDEIASMKIDRLSKKQAVSTIGLVAIEISTKKAKRLTNPHVRSRLEDHMGCKCSIFPVSSSVCGFMFFDERGANTLWTWELNTDKVARSGVLPIEMLGLQGATQPGTIALRSDGRSDIPWNGLCEFTYKQKSIEVKLDLAHFQYRDAAWFAADSGDYFAPAASASGFIRLRTNSMAPSEVICYDVYAPHGQKWRLGPDDLRRGLGIIPNGMVPLAGQYGIRNSLAVTFMIKQLQAKDVKDFPANRIGEHGIMMIDTVSGRVSSCLTVDGFKPFVNPYISPDGHYIAYVESRVSPTFQTYEVVRLVDLTRRTSKEYLPASEVGEVMGFADNLHFITSDGNSVQEWSIDLSLGSAPQLVFQLRQHVR